MSEKLAERLKAFTYQSRSAQTLATMAALRLKMQDMVTFLDEQLPSSREQLLAITALEESSMWAMKALSHSDLVSTQVSP